MPNPAVVLPTCKGVGKNCICTNLLQAKRVISETAKVGPIEVTTHGHKDVQPGSGQSGGPV
jgi:hypothetical protein